MPLSPLHGSFLVRMLGMALLTGPLPLFAQQIKVGSDTNLALPPGWRVIENHQDGTPSAAPSCLDTKASTLLLTARPEDPRRRVLLSVYRTAFQSPGPSPLDGDRGVQAETEKLLCSMLNLGYSPTDVKTTTSNSSKGTRIVTVEITGKGAAGDERIFTEAAAGEAAIVRLSLSRGKEDGATAQDLSAILSSLTVGEKLVVANSAAFAPGTPGSPAPASQPVGAIPPPSAPAPAQPSAETAKIVSEYSDALLIVEGKESTGSGFVCTMDGKPYVISNAHVICFSPGFKLTNVKGGGLTVGAGGVAVGHDIVRMEVQNPPKSFSVLENLDTSIKIGDEVAVLGNVRGAMVVKPVEGKIQGIGPNLIEVDAPFEPGNSGSPIVHKATGKVIGIATYLIKREVKNNGDTVTTDIRRFGYRLDSVKTWEPINWQVLFSQGATVGKIESVSDDFVRLFDSKSGSRFEPSYYKSPGMQRVMQSFSGRVKGRNRLSDGEQKMILQQFLGDLRSVSRNDIPSFDMRTGYDYFRRMMEEQISFRAEVYKDLSYQIEQRSSSWF
ncbi:MAG: serine protease [Chthoniobacteraceae bacterium]